VDSDGLGEFQYTPDGHHCLPKIETKSEHMFRLIGLICVKLVNQSRRHDLLDDPASKVTNPGIQI
jgi:hypothetical protein